MTIRYLLLVFLSISSFVYGESQPIWRIDLDAPDFAKNVIREDFDKYFTKTLTFDVEGINPSQVADFYSNFFNEIDWGDPFSGNSNRPQIPGGWSGYNMHMDTAGEPEAIYVKAWQSNNIPASGNLRLVLNEYNGNGYSGTVTVAVMPTVDMSPLFKLNELISSDPKNIFLLYKQLNANPFEIWKIDPSTYPDVEIGSLLDRYFQIVNNVEENYRIYGETYAP